MKILPVLFVRFKKKVIKGIEKRTYVRYNITKVISLLIKKHRRGEIQKMNYNVIYMDMPCNVKVFTYQDSQSILTVVLNKKLFSQKMEEEVINSLKNRINV